MHVCFIAASAEKRLAKSDTATAAAKAMTRSVGCLPWMTSAIVLMIFYPHPPGPHRAIGSYLAIPANSLPLSLTNTKLPNPSHLT